MKFKEGDKVTVLRVPARGKSYGIEVGMPGVILPIEGAEAREYAAYLGLVMVSICGPHFWWRERDLTLAPPPWVNTDAIHLVIADKGSYIPPNKQVYGYDPYNSAHAYSMYVRVCRSGAPLHG